jgi:tetratricopeptide (TPR) repeat protein
MVYAEAKQNQKALTTFEEARHEAETLQPDMLNGLFYFSYGQASEQAGLTDKAAELLKKSIELDPDGKTVDKPGEVYNYLGYMWVERGEHLDEAGELIKHALEVEPDNPAYIDSFGWWFFKKGEPQKAIEQLKKAAAAIKPEDAVVYEHLGDAYAKLNDVAQALVYWQKAAALEPENKTAIAEKIENAKQKMAHQQPATDAAPPVGAPKN